ncbi:hypothetical protein A0H81_04624 [Grifola frondosa]|uniref:Uncharacterized protein n=1 Tax=Grifola frondosa TaxID=5627 RepID=A0A1C7MJL5_GRIFR|nr:hypothetical protein A0H81_04624 [Grifola frondosa]
MAVHQLAVFCLGFFGWHYLLSIDIELSLVTRKRAFKWPFIPYLLGRYMLLSTLMSFVIASRIKHRMACGMAYHAFSGVRVFFRKPKSWDTDVVIWRRHLFVTSLLVVVFLGHFSLVIIQGVMGITASWDPVMATCVVIYSNDTLNAAFYLYTACNNLLILALTVYGRVKSHTRRDWLWNALCKQGVWYCVVTFLVNIPTTVFARLNLNPVMNLIFTLPAATVSVMASSFAVESLLDVDVKNMNMNKNSSAISNATNRGASWGAPSAPKNVWNHEELTASDQLQLSTYVISQTSVGFIDSSQVYDDTNKIDVLV